MIFFSARYLKQVSAIWGPITNVIMKKIFTKLSVSFLISLSLLLSAAFANGQQYKVIETGSYVTALAKDHQGNVYVTKFVATSNAFGVFKINITTGTSTMIYSGLLDTGTEYPWGLAVNSQGDVFVSTSASENKIVKLTYNSGTDSYVPTDFMGGKYATALAFDASDNLIVAEYNAASNKYRLVRYAAGTSSGGTVIYDNIPSEPGYSYNTSIAIALNQDIYFNVPYGDLSAPDQGAIIKITAADNYATATTISSGKFSSAVGVDELGNVYVSEYDGTQYYLYKYPSGGGSPVPLYILNDAATFHPWGIAVVNSGNIFFATGTSTSHPGGALVQLINTPVEPATNIIASNQTATSATLSWTNGSGTKRLVFMREGTTGTPAAADNSTYTPNAVFGSGSVDQVGGQWYCVYNGTGNSVDVTGLQEDQTYRVMVVEYNGVDGAQVYQTAVATDNPMNVSSALPVTWQSFEVNQSTGKYTWSWQLGVELQVAYYAPQYSLDGVHYQDAGKVMQNNDHHHYTFTTALDEPGQLYFRVMAVDNDGRKSYSTIKIWNSNDKTSALILYPNPVSDKLWIKWPGSAASSLQVAVYNVVGKRVLQKTLSNSADVSIPVAGLATGVYYLIVEDKLHKEKKTGKFLKK